MFRVELWELGPFGWRGSSDADVETDDFDTAQTVGRHQLMLAALDGIVAWVTVSDRDGKRVWECRNRVGGVSPLN